MRVSLYEQRARQPAKQSTIIATIKFSIRTRIPETQKAVNDQNSLSSVCYSMQFLSLMYNFYAKPDNDSYWDGKTEVENLKYKLWLWLVRNQVLVNNIYIRSYINLIIDFCHKLYICAVHFGSQIFKYSTLGP
jgi:hypothetical protein